MPCRFFCAIKPYLKRRMSMENGNSKQSKGSGSFDCEKIIKVVAAVMGVSYAWWTFRNLFSLVAKIPRLFLRPASALLDIAGLIFIIVPGAFMAAALLLLAFKRTEETVEQLFLAVVCGAAAVSAGKVIWMVSAYMARMIRGQKLLSSVPLSSAIVTSFAAVCAAGILFGLFCVSGRKFLVGRPKEQLTEMVRELPEFLREVMKQEMPRDIHGAGEYTGYGDRREPAHDPVMMPTGRNFFMYLIFNMLTCSLYGWYFYGKMAKDLNLMCDGDGETTVSLPMLIVLSVCTLGFYMYYWQYKFAARLYRNAGVFGADVREDGTLILILNVAGLFTCGLGQLAAMYMQIANLNKLSEAYNRMYFDIG